MAFNDIKGRILQIARILHSTFITVGNELRYDPSVPISDDYTLVTKYYVDNVSISPVYFTDNSNANISVNLGTGVIAIADVLNNFPVISGSGIIRGNFDVKKGSDWVPLDQFPEITKDIDGNILTAAFYLNDSFDKIRGRIF